MEQQKQEFQQLLIPHIVQANIMQCERLQLLQVQYVTAKIEKQVQVEFYMF